MIQLPTQILVSLAGTLVDSFMADKLTMLRAKTLEVTLHPADLVMSGPPFEVARARALLTEHLAFSTINQTWTKEANELENAVTALEKRFSAGKAGRHAALQQLNNIEEQRNRLNLEFEEWEVLERQQLLLERMLLNGKGEWAVFSSTNPAAPIGEQDAR